MRVLVVEDEPVLAISLQQFVESLGHEVCQVVNTAEEATFAAAIHRPDLVFMDYQLQGGRTGVDAAREIVEKQRSAIVFCTAQSDPRLLADIEAFGPAATITKPYSDLDIRIALARFARH
jgi:CheY-like chemotaxis protein